MHGLVLVLKHETFYGCVSTSVVADVVGNNTLLSAPRSTLHLLMTHTYILDVVNSFVRFHTLTTLCPTVCTLSLLSHHSDTRPIADLPPSDHFLCTPAPLLTTL